MPLSVSATRYQTDALLDEAERVHDALGLAARAVGVAEAHLDAVDDGLLQLVEVRRAGRGRAAPAGRVEHDGRRRRLGVGAERLGQRLDELAQRRLGLRRGRRRRAGDQEQRAGLGRGEPAEVGAGAAEQRPARRPGRPGSTPGCRRSPAPRGRAGRSSRTPRARRPPRPRSPGPGPGARGGWPRGDRHACATSSHQKWSAGDHFSRADDGPMSIHAPTPRRPSRPSGCASSSARSVAALDGLDLVAPAGAVTAVLGPNGAGKTTFVRSVATLLRPRRRLAARRRHRRRRPARRGPAGDRPGRPARRRRAGADRPREPRDGRPAVRPRRAAAAAAAADTVLGQLGLSRRRRPPRAQLLGRHAPAPRPRRQPRRRAPAAAARRADDRPRPAQPHRAVGRHPGPRRGRHRRAADDAVPRGGRPARRPRRHRRPRPGDRHRHARTS